MAKWKGVILYVNLYHYMVCKFTQMGILFHIIQPFQRRTLSNSCSELSSVQAF
jgi:hypothetical protein